MKEVRLSLTDLQNNPFHPELDVRALVDNVKRYYEKAPTWNFPVGQNAALRERLRFLHLIDHKYSSFCRGKKLKFLTSIEEWLIKYIRMQIFKIGFSNQRQNQEISAAQDQRLRRHRWT